jgi:hypothetical protein
MPLTCTLKNGSLQKNQKAIVNAKIAKLAKEREHRSRDQFAHMWTSSVGRKFSVTSAGLIPHQHAYVICYQVRSKINQPIKRNFKNKNLSSCTPIMQLSGWGEALRLSRVVVKLCLSCVICPSFVKTFLPQSKEKVMVILLSQKRHKMFLI